MPCRRRLTFTTKQDGYITNVNLQLQLASNETCNSPLITNDLTKPLNSAIHNVELQARPSDGGRGIEQEQHPEFSQSYSDGRCQACPPRRDHFDDPRLPPDPRSHELRADLETNARNGIRGLEMGTAVKSHGSLE